jgi:hypothetical protein
MKSANLDCRFRVQVQVCSPQYFFNATLPVTLQPLHHQQLTTVVMDIGGWQIYTAGVTSVNVDLSIFHPCE